MMSLDHQQHIHEPTPATVDEELSDIDDDEGDDDNEDDIELEEEDQQDDNGCLRFYIDLKDQGPIISWTALCASLEEGSHESKNAMDLDDIEESLSQGSYYDVNDPFIDDSELFDVEQSKRIETEMKGFFVQTGDIAVVEKKPRPKASKHKSKPAIRPATPEVDEYSSKEKVIIGGQVDEALTDELTSLRDLIHSNQEKLSDAEKKPMPVVLETALMNFEEKLRTVKATERKHVYARLSALFPSGSFLSKGNIKEKLKKLYVQWLPKKFDNQSKKIIRKLKQKIKKDVTTYESSLQSGDTNAGCVYVSKKSDGKLKYRCRWELFAPDLLELSTIARNFTLASNAAVQQKVGAKSKGLDNIATVELLQEDAVRRKYFKQILEFWPTECAVTSIHLNDAYKRYKIKNESSATGSGIIADKDSPNRRLSVGSTANANLISTNPEESPMPVSNPVSAMSLTSSVAAYPTPSPAAVNHITPVNIVARSESGPISGSIFDSPPPTPFADSLRCRHPLGLTAQSSFEHPSH